MNSWQRNTRPATDTVTLPVVERTRPGCSTPRAPAALSISAAASSSARDSRATSLTAHTPRPVEIRQVTLSETHPLAASATSQTSPRSNASARVEATACPSSTPRGAGQDTTTPRLRGGPRSTRRRACPAEVPRTAAPRDTRLIGTPRGELVVGFSSGRSVRQLPSGYLSAGPARRAVTTKKGIPSIRRCLTS